MLDTKSIKQSFNRAAKTYDEAAILQHEVAERLLERLEFMLIKPQTILDCGARTGFMTKTLQESYPKATILSLDIAQGLLEKNPSDYKICAGFESFPIQKQSVDIIISNCNFHWSNDLSACFREAQRILKPNGLLLFTMLGRDTLSELRDSFGEKAGNHVHSFLDMHEVGDQLLQSGFLDPVMDMERITLRYKSLKTLFQDLRSTGTQNANTERSRGLMGKKAWENMLKAYEGFYVDDAYPASFEIIYGHAWQAEHPVISTRNALGETRVSIDAIKRLN